MSTREIISIIITSAILLVILLILAFLLNYLYKSNKEEIDKGKDDGELLHSLSKKKKGIGGRIVSNIIFALFLIVLIPGIIIGVQNKVQGNEIRFGNSMPLVVASGSMSFKNEANPYLDENHLDNQFQTGDIVFISKVKSEEDLKKYDVVAYQNPELGVTVIHRIIGINTDENGNMTLTTRGDANNASDSYNAGFAEVVGRYEGKRIPKFGYVVLFLQSGEGIATIISIFLLYILLEKHRSKNRKVEEERKDKLMSCLKTLQRNETLVWNDRLYSYDGKNVIENKASHFKHEDDILYKLDSHGELIETGLTEKDKDKKGE